MDRKRDRIDVRNDMLRLSDDLLRIDDDRTTPSETVKSTKPLPKKEKPRNVVQMVKQFLRR